MRATTLQMGLLVVSLVACSSCKEAVAFLDGPRASAGAMAARAEPEPMNRGVDDAIHRVDFANFTYKWPSDLRVPGDPTHFVLRNGSRELTPEQKRHGGEMGVDLVSTTYGDVTRDGGEDALVFLSVTTGGSSMPGILYVFTMRDSTPEALWSVTSGDRAEGGMRAAYVEDGDLVVELSGEYQFVGDELKKVAEDLKKPEAAPEGFWSAPDCCPEVATRTRYRYQGDQFEPMSREVLPLGKN